MKKWPCGDSFTFYSVVLRDDVLIENNNYYGCIIMQKNGAMKIATLTHAQTAETRCSFLHPYEARFGNAYMLYRIMKIVNWLEQHHKEVHTKLHVHVYKQSRAHPIDHQALLYSVLSSLGHYVAIALWFWNCVDPQMHCLTIYDYEIFILVIKKLALCRQTASVLEIWSSFATKVGGPFNMDEKWCKLVCVENYPFVVFIDACADWKCVCSALLWWR